MKSLLVLLFLLSAIAFGISCWQKPAAGDQQAGSGGPSSGSLPVIDSLKTLVNKLKPGLGEFMIRLKYHYDRLGEAIAAKDYERAAYETDELKETTEKIVQLNITNDKLQKPFVLSYDKYLQSPLSVLADAAGKKDGVALRQNFTALTNNCNSCHHENNMSFMKIE